MKYVFGHVTGDVAGLYKALQHRTWYGKRIEYDLVARLNSYAAEAALKISGGSTVHIDIFAINGSLDEIQLALYDKVVHEDKASFISLSRKTIYVNTNKATKKVLKHEMSHGLFQNILGDKRVPVGLHEAVANYGAM